jgi:mannose-6-phosphate isomerase-like protein (cupin superfamily)
MIVHDLSPGALAAMIRTDLAAATEEPASPIGTFDFHGCIAGVASFSGRPPWEHHLGDELLHILEGGCRLTVRREAEEEARDLGPGDLVIVPKGCWHRNDAPGGVTMLYLTPSEGNRHSWDDPG